MNRRMARRMAKLAQEERKPSVAERTSQVRGIPSQKAQQVEPCSKWAKADEVVAGYLS